MQGLRRTFYRVSSHIRQSVLDAARTVEHYSFAIGALGIVGFIVYYPIWRTILPQSYENLTLRLIGGVLSALVMLKRFWPLRLQAYFPVFWYLTLLYVLPFFITFMMIQSGFSPLWLVMLVIGIYLLILFVDSVGFVTLSILGIGIAVMVSPSIVIPAEALPALVITPFAVASGMVVRYWADREAREKLNGILSAASSIAHELRTPLLGIQAGVAGLQKYFPTLLEGYQLAEQHGLPVSKMRLVKYRVLCSVLGRMEDEISYSNTMINMLLMNARKQDVLTSAFSVCSIVQCVESALARYPFGNQQDRSRVHWYKGEEDFLFLGSSMLMEHVLFNLLNNALYFIHKAQKGEIAIWLTKHSGYWQLHFKDTGLGVPGDQLPYIFNPFFSTKESGTGLGLSFCKKVVKSFNGEMTCQSVFGEYAEFILSFPMGVEQS